MSTLLSQPPMSPTRSDTFTRSETFTRSVTPSDTYTRSVTPSNTNTYTRTDTFTPSNTYSQTGTTTTHTPSNTNTLHQDVHADQHRHVLHRDWHAHAPRVPPPARAGLPALAPRLRPQHRRPLEGAHADAGRVAQAFFILFLLFFVRRQGEERLRKSCQRRGAADARGSAPAGRWRALWAARADAESAQARVGGKYT
ncbi:hypothetical protein DFH08DRAFT_340766 [Mycena albidolilacea]|uniref:Uncharacterized protein n=1 Tax=Mycena albidolilacea TaxID=1033008 RepID=A0AAD6ZKS1_9AGAR|nr:hypothetical protein DFH08DRAFT_340766 [Mycena albidolilacea]